MMDRARAEAQRESRCRQCGEKIEKGEECLWISGKGIFHPDCVEKFDEQREG